MVVDLVKSLKRLTFYLMKNQTWWDLSCCNASKECVGKLLFGHKKPLFQACTVKNQRMKNCIACFSHLGLVIPRVWCKQSIANKSLCIRQNRQIVKNGSDLCFVFNVGQCWTSYLNWSLLKVKYYCSTVHHKQIMWKAFTF